MSNENDRLRRFLFEDAPVRGHWVRLAGSWIEAREHQQLPQPAMTLLGESMAAVALLSASLKFSGTLTLQLAGSQGGVSMMVTQATSPPGTRALRGIAHLADDQGTAGAAFEELVRGGRLVVSVEQGSGSQPWQGIVPLEGASLAACLERYFENSEQLPTALVLAADAGAAAGLLLQKLPSPGAQGEAAGADSQGIWEEAVALLGTLGGDELLATEPAELLRRLFGARDLRLFDAEPIRFACRCGPERVAQMLKGLGQTEVDAIIAEQGAVTVTCEFCCKPYRFDAVDAAQLFLPAGPGNQSRVS